MPLRCPSEGALLPEEGRIQGHTKLAWRWLTLQLNLVITSPRHGPGTSMALECHDGPFPLSMQQTLMGTPQMLQAGGTAQAAGQMGQNTALSSPYALALAE